MDDLLSLITLVVGLIAAIILLAAFVIVATVGIVDSHFGRSVFPSVMLGGILILIVRETDPSGVGIAVVLWFGAIILAGAYGAVLDAWHWLRGNYE